MTLELVLTHTSLYYINPRVIICDGAEEFGLDAASQFRVYHQTIPAKYTFNRPELFPFVIVKIRTLIDPN